MSLISDPDYLIHSLRLTYLRHSEDPYAPRIISVSPRYLSNPHVLAAGLSNTGKWPELNVSPSTFPSDDEDDEARRRNGFPGATGLKYTQTIMGPSRIGALGMRVSGKRSMTVKEPMLAAVQMDGQGKRLRSDSAPTPVSAEPLFSQQAADSPGIQTEPGVNGVKRRTGGGSSLSHITVASVASGQASDSERNLIEASALHPEHSKQRPEPQSHFSFDSGIRQEREDLNPEASSSESSDAESGSVSEDDIYDNSQVVNGSLDMEGEEFDPDFAPPRIGIVSESMSDLASMPTSAVSTSQRSAFPGSLQVSQSADTQNKLSPVTENHNDDQSAGTTERASSLSGPPHLRINGQSSISPFTVESPTPLPQSSENTSAGKKGDSPCTSGVKAAPELLFVKRSVPPARRSESALSAKLAMTSSASSNPFTELYALISGRTQSSSMEVMVFLPHASKPAGKPLKLNVRKDASVEEVLGFALWSYWEEGWLPKLDEGLGGEDDPKRKLKLSALGWVLRLAEDDGEVDEDFPAPDRMSKISKFSNVDAWAVLEATPGQVAQNQQLESKIIRRPSRIIVAKKKQETTTNTLAPPIPTGPGTSAPFGSTLGASLALSSSFGLSSSQGPQILLRVRMADESSTAVHYSTTISVSSGMYMQEALEQVCRRRKLTNPKEWALVVDDPKTVIPLDRTVASLQGKSDLILMKRSVLFEKGYVQEKDRRINRSTDPNASIFKRGSEVPEAAVSAQLDFTSAYKRYTVYRKLPMAVVRLERTFAIDGDYIHIMPAANKGRAVFDSMKTTSFHIKSVVACTQSAKSSSSFKFVVRRDSGEKRYDFEAEDNKLATEIVTCIRQLKNTVDRPGTGNKVRRSRHVS